MTAQTPKTYLYAISRRDIPLAQQAIQAGHAAIEYAYEHGRPADHHPSYIHCTVRDQHDLLCLRTELKSAGIFTSEFHEPYKNWGLTAIACVLSEEQRGVLKHLKLWRIPTQGDNK